MRHLTEAWECVRLDSRFVRCLSEDLLFVPFLITKTQAVSLIRNGMPFVCRFFPIPWIGKLGGACEIDRFWVGEVWCADSRRSRSDVPYGGRSSGFANGYERTPAG